jgi:hypothetical protein
MPLRFAVRACRFISKRGGGIRFVGPTYVFLNKFGVSGVDVDALSMVPIVANAITGDHPSVVIGLSTNTEGFVAVGIFFIIVLLLLLLL